MAREWATVPTVPGLTSEIWEHERGCFEEEGADEAKCEGKHGIDRQTISPYDIAMRTIIDLPPEQIRALDGYRKKQGISRAEAVRRAVASFLPAKPGKQFDFRKDPAFGSSRDFRKEDSVELVRRLRKEWER